MIYQTIQNGEVVGNTSAATTNANGTSEVKNKDKMAETKEMFLKLLVTEMQYQDPMQPTDNSEYVKELANFTQVETLGSVQDEVEKLSANSLVGKYVTLTDSDTGQQYEGKVDYVTTQGGTTYVSVGGSLYELSEIDSVEDSTYFEAAATAQSFTNLVNNLPNPEGLSLSDLEKVNNVSQLLGTMNDYTQGFVSEDTFNRFADILERMDEIVAQAEYQASQSANGQNSDTGAQTPDGTDDGAEDIPVSEA